MPGRPPWSQPGTDGGGQSIAVNDRPDLVADDYTQTGSMSASSIETTEVYPPTGSIYNVQAMYIKVPSIAAATGGNHHVRIQEGDKPYVLEGDSNYDTIIRWDFSQWMDAGTQNPSDPVAQGNAVRALRSDSAIPIKFVYYNGTDAAQDGDREYQLVLERRDY